MRWCSQLSQGKYSRTNVVLKLKSDRTKFPARSRVLFPLSLADFHLDSKIFSIVGTYCLFRQACRLPLIIVFFIYTQQNSASNNLPPLSVALPSIAKQNQSNPSFSGQFFIHLKTDIMALKSLFLQVKCVHFIQSPHETHFLDNSLKRISSAGCIVISHQQSHQE